MGGKSSDQDLHERADIATDAYTMWRPIEVEGLDVVDDEVVAAVTAVAATKWRVHFNTIVPHAKIHALTNGVRDAAFKAHAAL